ncbi:hypothetical protein QR680_007309 [Steinernema hermaphroditum]|uniref:Uncharacterized protein n=1 Tax=Steinernema hermaphroditum TaxID=289476 RepID=A0AA39IF05_9BILA|nr:hypothetical protein QR680_007309 [Steinernema hermaphroditum]
MKYVVLVLVVLLAIDAGAWRRRRVGDTPPPDYDADPTPRASQTGSARSLGPDTFPPDDNGTHFTPHA